MSGNIRTEPIALKQFRNEKKGKYVPDCWGRNID